MYTLLTLSLFIALSYAQYELPDTSSYTTADAIARITASQNIALSYCEAGPGHQCPEGGGTPNNWRSCQDTSVPNLYDMYNVYTAQAPDTTPFHNVARSFTCAPQWNEMGDFIAFPSFNDPPFNFADTPWRSVPDPLGGIFSARLFYDTTGAGYFYSNITNVNQFTVSQGSTATVVPPGGAAFMVYGSFVTATRSTSTSVTPYTCGVATPTPMTKEITSLLIMGSPGSSNIYEGTFLRGTLWSNKPNSKGKNSSLVFIGEEQTGESPLPGLGIPFFRVAVTAGSKIVGQLGTSTVGTAANSVNAKSNAGVTILAHLACPCMCANVSSIAAPSGQTNIFSTANTGRSSGNQPLKWEKMLRKIAIDAAGACRITKSVAARADEMYTQNLLGPVTTTPGNDAFASWLKANKNFLAVNKAAYLTESQAAAAQDFALEVNNYDCLTNTCTRGYCGHYLNQAGKNSRFTGCARKLCNTGSPFGSFVKNWWLVVCVFDSRFGTTRTRPASCL